MSKWENKSTDTIVLEMKEMQQEYEALKSTIGVCLDKMDKMEVDFQEGKRIISTRLKK
jgi:hypothetical protein